MLFWSKKQSIYGEFRPIAYDPFIYQSSLPYIPNATTYVDSNAVVGRVWENDLFNGLVRYNIAGDRDLKAILILHEAAAYILSPLILFVIYHLFPYFLSLYLGESGLDMDDMGIKDSTEKMSSLADRWRYPVHYTEMSGKNNIRSSVEIRVHGGGKVMSDMEGYRTRKIGILGRFGEGLDNSYYCMDEGLDLMTLWIPTCAVIGLGHLSVKALHVTQWTPSIYMPSVCIFAKQWSWLYLPPFLFFIFISCSSSGWGMMCDGCYSACLSVCISDGFSWS